MTPPTTAELVEMMRHCTSNNCIMCPAFDPPTSHCFEYLEAAANRLEALEHELSKIKARTRWVPVTEGLPEPRETVLTICVTRRENSKKIHRINCRDALGEWMMTFPLYAVTHWMPLPEPPKEDEHHE